MNKTGFSFKQFLFAVKATAFKQETSQFYPQFLSTEVSFYATEWYKCGSYLLCLETADKILIFAVLKQWLLLPSS